MKSTSPLSNSPVPVNFYSEEYAFILDEYCYRQMASILPALRRLLVNKIHITARSFILLFQRNYLYNPDRMKISPQDLEKLSNLYETLRVTGGPAERSSRGKKDFNLRCRVISDLIPMPAEALEKFMCGSRRRFHLFGCLNDVIFEHLKLSDNKREILNHQFGFSDRYEQIRKAELAKRQNISRSSVSSAAAVISRKTDDAIKRFKFLEPYGYAGFLAEESKNIMQTPESEVDKKSFKRLFEKMGKDIEAMENLWDSEDYMKVLDYMMRRGKKKQL